MEVDAGDKIASELHSEVEHDMESYKNHLEELVAEDVFGSDHTEDKAEHLPPEPLHEGTLV